MSSPASALGFRDVLKTPAVKRLWIAQVVSIFGDFLAVFAVAGVWSGGREMITERTSLDARATDGNQFFDKSLHFLPIK
jgi:hypothetical protein